MQIRVEAPEDADVVDVAQALVGPHILLKAESVPLKYGERTFKLYKVLRELNEKWTGAYRQQLDKMVRRVWEFVGTNVMSRPARAHEQMFGSAELHAIRNIVRDYHQAFVVGTIGTDFIAPDEVQRLIDDGYLPQDLNFTYQPAPKEKPPDVMRAVRSAYDYGLSLGKTPPLRDMTQIKQMSAETFASRRPPKLTAQEEAARVWAQQSAAKEVVGLGNTVAEDFSTIAIEADAGLRAQYQGEIAETVDASIARQESWRKAASEMGHKTGDWSRDFDRIAATEKQKAMQHGMVAGLIDREGDPKNIYVAKQPAPDACPDCMRLHTEGGGKLRIFKLSTLMNNGSNRGRKRIEWKAVVGVMHPWCGCELIHVPAGWGFDEDGNLMPQDMLRSELMQHDLMKASDLDYGGTVPTSGIAIRVGDPVKRLLIEEVVAETPPEIFDINVGVTLITTDHPRVQNPLDEHDLAYWTGNEIRLAVNLKPSKVKEVMRHELGHSLNVYLMHQMGGIPPVRRWHNKLWKVSKDEGFVTKYARTNAIENAAETTRLYLYERKHLMQNWPRTFSMLRAAYKNIW